MQFSIPKEKVPNPLAALRKAGYVAFTDPNTGEDSFTLRLSGDFYPRFHLYLSEKGGKVVFDLHLDQKKPSYGGSHAHAGEYDGPTVEKEIKRVAGWVIAVGNEK